MTGVSAMFFGGSAPSFVGLWDINPSVFYGNAAGPVVTNADATGASYALTGGATTQFSDNKGYIMQVDWSRYTSVAKYVSAGSGGSGSSNFTDIKQDSGKNPIATYDGGVVKMDTTGAVTWQQKLSSGATSLKLLAVGVDSSDNVYVGLDSSGVVLAKYNSSGVYQWQRKLSDSNNPTFSGMVTDSSGNTFLSYELPPVIAGVAKYDNTGAIQWQKGIDIAPFDGSVATVGGIALDSSGSIYVSVSNYSTTFGYYSYLVKLSSAGVFTWARYLASDTIIYAAGSVYVDSSDNIYVGFGDGYKLKFTASGTLTWQRRLSSNGGAGIETYTSVDNDNFMWLSGTTSSYSLLMRVLSDGTGTGSYPIYVGATLADTILYETIAGSVNNNTLTVSTTTCTDAAGTLTNAASSLTFSNASVSSYTVTA